MPERFLIVPVIALAALLGPSFPLQADESADAADATAEPASEGAETDVASSADTEPDDAEVLADASYAIGMNVFRNFQDQGFAIDIDRFAEGMRAAADEAEPTMTLAEQQAAIMAAQRVLEARKAAEAEVSARAGRDVLAANRADDTITETDSGLQYQVLEEGDGASPDASDSVTVHYEGRLVDGTVFDSSYQRGQPATFGLGQVIPGWTEGVALMNEGAKYRFWIPSDLAYGQRGSPRGGIGPNQMLIFDVELLEVNAANPAE